MDIYICPACKAQNVEHQKYCVNCGTWLLSTAYPAKKVGKSASKKRAPQIIFPLIILALVLFGLYKWNNSAKFGDIVFENKYTISQLVVNRPLLKGPSATADFIAQTDTEMPLEVAAVFYDGSTNRLGKATALIGTQLSKGQTTTISLQFEGAANLSKMANVRIEVTPLSPLMLLERAANKAGQIMSQ